MWSSFLRSKRHEVAEVSGDPSQRLVMSADWKRIRELSFQCPAARGVARGAMLCPASIGKAGALRFSASCIFRLGSLLSLISFGNTLADPNFWFGPKTLWMLVLVGFPHDAIVWEPPTVEMLVEISRNSKGGEAASVDGWKADELKHVPPKGLGVFSCSCLDLWEKHGRVPVALQHSRMVNLPKKPNAGIVDIENIRPITILSCFWRVWAGAYVKSPFVQKWLASLPEEIVAGKGADAQLAASELWGNAQL